MTHKIRKSFRPHAQTVAEVLKFLETTKYGLEEKTAKARLAKEGYNKLIAHRSTSPYTILISQFKNSLIVILLVAFSLSLALGETADALIIALAIITNIIFGFIQEYKAYKAFAALKKMIAYTAHVIREGEICTVPVESIVRGDIIVLQSGTRIPADARVISSHNLLVNEAPLTGESTPVLKQQKPLAPDTALADRANMLFLGTTVFDGSAHAVVVYTGMKTELGKIAKTLEEDPAAVTPLERRLEQFSRLLGLIIISIAAFVFMVGVLVEKPLFDMLKTAIAIAVAALPEGLAVAMTVILAVGMQRILKKKALINKLLAAETLGSTTIICTDKTGTLTKGEMELDKIITFKETIEKERHKISEPNEDLIRALELAILCNDAQEETNTETQEVMITGSPTEKSLYAAAFHGGIDTHDLHARYNRVDELLFTSARKFMATVHEYEGNHYRVLYKGAPEKVLPHITHALVDNHPHLLNKEDKEMITHLVHDLTSKGYRLLIGAYKELSDKPAALSPIAQSPDELSKEFTTDLIFICYFGIRDPIRTEVKETLRLTKSAGIQTLMVTGDHELTATVIAKEVGLITEDAQVMNGATLHRLSDDELASCVTRDSKKGGKTKIAVFARISPDDKLRLIRILKEQGEVVAMTGDGVNDVPALVRADIGIALGSGTDVAKQASDIVLLDNNFSVIVNAIEEGRVIFDNLRKVILYLLSDSFASVILITLALILSGFVESLRGLPLPITAAQILWINIISDGFPSFALTLEPREQGIMRNPPRSPRAPLVSREMKLLIGIISGVTALLVLVVFILFWQSGNAAVAHTVAFMSLGINSLCYIFSIRSLRSSIFKQNPLSNRWLILGICFGAVLQLSTVFVKQLREFLGLTTLGPLEWGVIILQSSIVITVIELIKAYKNKELTRNAV